MTTEPPTPVLADPADIGPSRKPVLARPVVFWGTYDLGKPRTRILRDSLRGVGVEVVEIHADIWCGHEDKSQAGTATILMVLLRALLAYPGLAIRYLRAPAHDAVIVPYLGQFDVLFFTPLAWLRRKPVIWDMFISLYDTAVCDRRMIRASNPIAYGLWALERCACRAADLVLLDTPTHARRIADLFGLGAIQTDAVPVGAEPGVFGRIPPHKPHDGPTLILFYGQLIPLHGIETILKAALSERGREHRWHIIGTGQDSYLVEAALAAGTAPHVTWERWRSYNKLIGAIEKADVCLGIFGASEKAASVVPNKVYQCLMAGRTVITRRSEAISEAFPVSHPSLVQVAHSDHVALLDAIDEARGNDFPAIPEDYVAAARPEDIGRQLVVLISNICEGTSAYAQ
ncbi:glycosyltransferase [Silicimonas algicola]|uniref:Glycosyltransferase involved in cell wall biosynthesis n=1 Tax=Silicimonas algicola TaxID=1826607 RepID=A0A316GDJ4_9RHOB|nr:glycosyltransferase [Silicimonas algicola]AZQ66688.1 glycosyltransferase [Silicimonas algicola]PWK59041.1 glycosyltransferase involved in cell wall biosynthesis [Silicimonas algicola]